MFMIATDVELTPIELATGTPSTAWWMDYQNQLLTMGTKDYPLKLDDGSQYHPDNVFVEFATTPALNHVDLLTLIEQTRQKVEAAISTTLVGRDYVKIPEFDPGLFPWLSRHVSYMGCAKDMVMNQYRAVPDEVKHSPFKEAGFHLHLNLPDHVLSTCRKIRVHNKWVIEDTELKVLGYVQELAGAIGQFHSNPTEYSAWYRQPGCYRIKPYGVEYRSLGAGILADTDRLVSCLDTVERFTRDYYRRSA
jgi:hypothetical protein